MRHGPEGRQSVIRMCEASSRGIMEVGVVLCSDCGGVSRVIGDFMLCMCVGLKREVTEVVVSPLHVIHAHQRPGGKVSSSGIRSA